MAFTAKDLSGALFKNDKKEKDTHPAYKGSALIDGVEYWQSAWIKEDKNGNKYLSQSFERKKQQPPGQQVYTEAAPVTSDNPQHFKRNDMDDEVPF